MPFFDLASLTKPLVTAPLALAFLDLDSDRREELGFHERREPLTVRQLLSHSSGLPPWLPCTGEALSAQMRRGWPLGEVPLLRVAMFGRSTYSDLGYRLIAELLESECGVPWKRMGEAFTGLSAAPWSLAPARIPPGPDFEAWRVAAPQDHPFPPAAPKLPHDANARAGMIGHAGFGAAPAQMQAWLGRWIAQGWASRMATPTAESGDGGVWGLGLQVSLDGEGRFGRLLARVPEGLGGLHLVASDDSSRPPEIPPLEGPPGQPTGWWYHTGFTGPLLCFRPSDRCCLALLCHRAGPDGELLDLDQLRSRRTAMLEGLVAGLRG